MLFLTPQYTCVYTGFGLEMMFLVTLLKTDSIKIETPGGGGYGYSKDRPEILIEKDREEGRTNRREKELIAPDYTEENLYILNWAIRKLPQFPCASCP